MKILFPLIFTFVFSIHFACAWDAVGHLIVGQTAYNNLTPEARAAVDASIESFNKKHGTDYTFVSSGCWMDDIRSETKKYNAWHYINLPYNPEAKPFPGREETNVLSGIRLCEAILRGERTHKEIDQDQALVMLIHLIGDVHQPLHTTSHNNDAGGNKVWVRNMKDAILETFPRWRNLHYFWDCAYRRTLSDGVIVETIEAPVALIQDPPRGRQEVLPAIGKESDLYKEKYNSAEYPTDGNPKDWIIESHRTGILEAYKKLPGGESGRSVELSEPYVINARDITRQKLVQGGLRVAVFLNELYSENSPSK